MNRRDLLAAGAVTLVAPLAPIAVASTETPVAAAYREWLAFRDHINGPATNGTPNRDFDDLVEELDEMADAMLPIPCQTSEDFIMKVIANTDWGQGGMPDLMQMPQLWAEARALVEGRA